MNTLIDILNSDLKKIKVNIAHWINNISRNNLFERASQIIDRKLYNIFDLLNNDSAYLKMPGQNPFIRGAYSSMYTDRLWTIRQYSGFGTAQSTNIFYQDCLKNGQKGLSVAFDLPTHRGIDSDELLATGDVGKTGVAIDSVEDMKILFHKIPLDSISVSMTMNGAVLPILAAYIVAAEEMGVQQSKLQGTIQNDILKEFIVRNTYIYPPSESMRIVGDIIFYLSKYIPKFHPISISGYHFQEAGASPDLELGLTLANGIEYVRLAMKYGLNIDNFASRLSFFFAIGMNFFTEIAKLRAARWLWASLIKPFHPIKLHSRILKMHCQTSGWSLSATEPLNNIVRTTIEAMSAVFGGTQSLHTNSFDEALALPSDESSQVARNTQIILQQETGIPHVIDPLGGAYYVESLTQRIYRSALFFINKIKKNGGVINGIKSGLQKKWILQEAIKKQALIDAGETKIVGEVKRKNSEIDYPIRHIKSENVVLEQKRKIHALKKHRNSSTVKNILNYLKKSANDQTNLLKISIDAIRARSTIGEISHALASVFGRYHTNTFSISNVYKHNFTKKYDFRKMSKKIASLSSVLGHPPRILMTKIGQDGHDRGLICIASALADLGFDIDLLPLFPKISEIVNCAVNNDANVIGISSMTGGHMDLIPLLFKEFKNRKITPPKIVVGGIIQKKESDILYGVGVASIFYPGLKILDIANNILTVITKNYDSNFKY